MKKSKFPAVAAKKPNYAPSDLKKLELGDAHENVRFTGSTAASKAAAQHRNTIVNTDNRTDLGSSLDSDIDADLDTSLDSDIDADLDTSIGHVKHADGDIDWDSIDLASSTDGYLGTGHHEDSATVADFEEWERDQVQKFAGAGAGTGRSAESAAATASSDSTDGSDGGKGTDDTPLLDAGQFDAALIKHVADCLCIDTVGLEFTGIEPDDVKLNKSFGQQGDDGLTVSGTEWSKGSAKSPTGKRSLIFDYVAKTKKLGIEGSNAMHRQGHNIVASGDMIMTAYSMVKAMIEENDLGWRRNVDYQVAHGVDVEVTRIDVFLLLQVPDGVSKADLINANAIAGVMAGMDISLYSSESVYFNQSSQTEAGKIYDKAAQLRRARKGHQQGLADVEELLTVNSRTLRVEFVFRAKRLVQIAKAFGGRPHPCLFTKELLALMVLTLMQKFALQGNIFRRLEHAELLAIPLPYRSTFAHWQNGEVLLDMVKSERVLKEHKTFLKMNFNINLNKPYPGLVREPMSLAEILVPENFVPVPKVVRNNPELFYQIDMEEERHKLKKQVGNGICSVILDPYRAPDISIMRDGKKWVI